MSTYGFVNFRSALASALVFALATLTALPAAAQARATLKGHTLALASIDYSRDGRYLAPTREVLREHGGLWFYDESFVVSRRR